MSPAAETKERILRGASEVVLRDGVARLTLEAAAAEAGVSKGGVLYHFASRGALVAAMVERLGASFDADLERRDAYSGLPGAFTNAYLESTFEPAVSDEETRERRLGAAVIAGVAADADLLEPLRRRFAAWQAAIAADGLPAGVTTAVRLAADGLWIASLLELAPIEGEARAAVHSELRRLVDEAVAAATSPAGR